MSTKKLFKNKELPKKTTVKKVPKVKVQKVKVPKFKLVSYTLKAVIPTGQYANIQPEITVQARSIEAAERAVMPYIETLFAKYRDGGVKPIEPVVRPVVTVSPVPANASSSPAYSKPASVSPQGIPPVAPNPVTPVATPPVAPTPAPTAPVAPAIVLTVPFNRAKSAIESCMSRDALKLVSDQIEKSVKLIDTEKVELKKLVTDKFETLK